jgi:hypothetical protein
MATPDNPQATNPNTTNSPKPDTQACMFWLRNRQRHY